MEQRNKKIRAIPTVDPRTIDEIINEKLANDYEKEIEETKEEIIDKEIKIQNINTGNKRPYYYEEQMEISILENEIKDSKEEIIEKLYLLKEKDSAREIHAISLRKMQEEIEESEQSFENAQEDYEIEETTLEIEKSNCKEIRKEHEKQLEILEHDIDVINFQLEIIAKKNEEKEKELEEIRKKNEFRYFKKQAIESLLYQSEEEIERLEMVLGQMVYTRLNKMNIDN
ncbi:hypothetical protein DICPUDRAFT_77035 [Dictyostelium purpureum]|uniref:Uncharacterized protein n=1 Tax=Dictyostelium purpureum TaxID=5786 RepID=F0ZFE8_DICPU|nr:uncharacterized protein DICPUDRAFT_77035 [Dictyostelium purpureum]EGC37322.1 hypothetical protein DICPUDRAFT_77035 [Dictyostelium purpureum]|eukprot:XP_003286136.1 hypothetical protein DICPUDRAFT_77035 [Dictyostelium purpureum]